MPLNTLGTVLFEVAAMQTSNRVRTLVVPIVVAVLSAITAAAQPQKPVTNADIVAMVKAGLSEELVIGVIQRGPSKFDVSVDALIELKNQHVAEKAIQAMIEAGSPQRPAPSPAKDAAQRVVTAVKELNRDTARALINGKPEFATTRALPMDTAAFDVMVRDKLWYQPSFGAWWQPIPETKRYFTAVSIAGFTLAQPLSRTVQAVDGITDGVLPGTKVVVFKYSYLNVPDFIRKHLPFAASYGANAVVRQYDDGWRVETVEFH
jgi:hypothetical protein